MDNRRAARLRTFKGGSIFFGVAAAIDCTIRNMSPTGAALEVGSPVGIPDEFTLLVTPEFVKRNCRVAWRSANRIGVQFAKRLLTPGNKTRIDLDQYCSVE